MTCRTMGLLSLALLGTSSAPAQQGQKLRIDGLIDGYYSWNQNHPFTGENQWHLFDTNADAWSLSLARLAIDRETDPVGFHAELGAGNTYKLMSSFDSAPHILKYIPQAYVKWKPSSLNGVQLDFGKFYTSTGIEVLDTDQNWNYSRSLLFSWAQPAYHFGLRTTIPLAKHIVVGAQVVNGWNNVRDNNTSKTLGLTANLTWSRMSWTNVYYGGPEKTGTNQGWRQLYDTALLVMPRKPVIFYVNFDYAVEPRIEGGKNQWAGIGGAARITAGPKFSVSPRVEWFFDADGFATGTEQRLKEVTLTAEWKLCRGFASRLEFRRDWSDRATLPAKRPGELSKSQNTVTLGLLATFSMKR
jgi:putative OmpL-like beta-barrel porin-2